MRYSKWLAGFALALGMALPGASALSAADPYWDRQELRRDYRDLRQDSYNVERLRWQIARDRDRLAEDVRCHRDWAAVEDSRVLARDQRALEVALWSIRRDRANTYWDRRDYYRDTRDDWRFR